jgi:hypothetical protein
MYVPSAGFCDDDSSPILLCGTTLSRFTLPSPSEAIGLSATATPFASSAAFAFSIISLASCFSRLSRLRCVTLSDVSALRLASSSSKYLQSAITRALVLYGY